VDNSVICHALHIALYCETAYSVNRENTADVYEGRNLNKNKAK